MQETVEIKGMGCITPIGNTVEKFSSALSGFIPGNSVKQHSTSLTIRNITEFDYLPEGLTEACPQLDIACRYVLAATEQALRDADIDLCRTYDCSRVAVVMGTTFNIIDTQERYLDRLYKTGVASPLLFKHTANNLLSGIIAQRYGLKGFNMTISNGWTSGLDALITGKTILSCKQADLVIAGGVDVLNSSVLEFYEGMKREGFLKKEFIAGEGCGVVLLGAGNTDGTRSQKPRNCMIEAGKGNYFTDNDIQYQINSIFKKEIKIDNYFANYNKSKIDSIEKDALEQNFVGKVLDIKSMTGECGASSGILQLIYSTVIKDTVSCIFNACFMGHASYVIVGRV